MDRQHAREAVRLLKQERPKRGLGHLGRTNSEVVQIATKIALDLQKGQIPEWYARLLEKDALEKLTSSSSSQSKHTPSLQNNYVQEDVIELSSSDSKDTTTPTPLTSPSECSHSKWKSKKLVSLRTFMKPAPPSSKKLLHKEQTLSLSRITTKSPPTNFELPLIDPGFRQSFSFSGAIRGKDRRKKPPSTAIGLRSKKYRNSYEDMNKRKMINDKVKRKKCFVDARDLCMENSKITSQYWNVPFDPFREHVLTQHKIFNMEKIDSENEQDISLTKKEVLVHTDYWEIQKIMRFVRIGNPTATVLALCALKDLELQKPSHHEIIRHLHGISLFLNILSTDNRRCRIAALKVLARLASSSETSNIILKRDGIKQLVSVLIEDDKIVVSLACDVLSSLTLHNNVRVVVNKLNIVEKLMSIFKDCVKRPLQGSNIELFRSVCNALWSCCLSVRSKDVRIISESLHDIYRMVEILNEELAYPLLGIVEQCASMEYFRCKLEEQNFIEKFLSKLGSTERTKILAVKIIFKCASNERCQKTLLKPENLQDIMKLFKQTCQETNDELLTLLLGIIWKCSLNKEHMKKFENHGVFPLLSTILKSDKNTQVKSTAIGVVAEFLWDETYTDSAGNHELINLLIDFMSINEPSVLVHSARALGVGARNKTWRKTILQLDGLRLLWSLLKSPNEELISSGAVALASVCLNPEESANAVRSIVGGIELLMTLLAASELTKHNVLICLCEAAVSIAEDAENRSILIDYDLIPVLLNLSKSKNKILRYYVTCLISRCCESSKERDTLSNCIPYLIEGLEVDFDDHIHCESICALNKLSGDFKNCMVMKENNTIKTLMNLLASSNEKIQDAAAECLANVRKSIVQVSIG